MKTFLAVIAGLAVIGIVGCSSGENSHARIDRPPDGQRNQADDPLGQGLNGCSQRIEKISRMIEKDDQGERVYSGQLDAWLETNCSSEVDSQVAGGNVTGRDARLWINCNKEKFWVEYVRFTKNGETVRERTKSKEQDALEADEDGELMLPNSFIAQMTDQSCRVVAGGGAAK